MPRRLSRTLALLLAGAALAGAGCADDVAPAIRVGDVTVSDGDLQEETDQFAGNEGILDPSTLTGFAPGARPADLLRQVIAQRIHFEIHGALFEEAGLELDESDVARAFEAAYGNPAQAERVMEGFEDEGFAEEYRRDVARMVLLQEELGTDYEAAVQEAYADADIEVSPRYGDWDAEAFQVVPATLGADRG